MIIRKSNKIPARDDATGIPPPAGRVENSSAGSHPRAPRLPTSTGGSRGNSNHALGGHRLIASEAQHDFAHDLANKPSARILIGRAILIIDIGDWERLSHLPWRAGFQSRRTVITRQVGSSGGQRRNIYIYQDILGVTPADGWVDHINGDPLDNRRCNLRVCTPAQNCMNRGPVAGKAVPYKGVTRKRRRFAAKVGGKLVGVYGTAEDAALAYDAAALDAYGQFAWLNTDHFPEIAQAKEENLAARY